MALGVQIIGLIFSVVMIYLSYTYYKRKSYSWRSFVLWTIVWLAVLLVISFPETVYGVMEVLHIHRTADFFVMVGFTLFAIAIFYLYITVKSNDRRVENIVRAIALERAQQKKSSTTVKRRVGKKR